MSDAGESGDIKESFEDENKVNIEATSVNLYCVKNEPNAEALDFEEDSLATRYKITLGYENIFGEPSLQKKIEEDSNNLIGFLDNDVIMENEMIKIEAIKEEDDGSFNNFYCTKCKEIYKDFCLKCSTLLCVLNSNLSFINSEFESNTIPTDILEIRETSKGKGVYLLRTLPINIIFGPFEGILGIESTVGYHWKIIDNKLGNIKSGNWMKNIVCAASSSLKNLDVFQIDSKLYFQTNREIIEGEELLVYYNDEELQQLDNSEECLYTPQKQENLPKIFACTMCCLGFGSNKCLVEHKRKCCRIQHSKSMKDFLLIECHYCKMWMEKWEHEKYHVAYCLEKHHRMWTNYSEAVDNCGTEGDKITYQRDICSRQYHREDDLQFDTKDFQCFSGANRQTCLNECVLAERSNEQIENTIETNNKSNFKEYLNKHRGIKPFACDICTSKFTTKSNLKVHTKNKHTNDESGKDYKCLECDYRSNYKSDLKKHLNTHSGIKPFQCDICMVKFAQKDSLFIHIKNKHTLNPSAKYYKCSECSFRTNYKNYLQKHVNKHKGIKPITCDICMMKFVQKAHLKMHIKYKHTDDVSAKNYKCLECSYQTNCKYYLQRHVNRHKGIRAFKCDICTVKFTTKGHLQIHKRNKHIDDGRVKDYKCLECPYQTNYKSQFQIHLNKHKGIKPFKCDICVMNFALSSQLKAHVKNKHADDDSPKDYKCLECSFQTNHQTSFQRHLNKHKGIKFQCDICTAKFTCKSSLKAHIKNKHTDDAKDYKCLECSYQTNHKGHFQTHMNKHRGIKLFNCDICLKKFTQKGNLAKHLKRKHSDDGSTKDHKCLECPYQAKYKSQLKKHLKKHLNEDVSVKPFQCDICMMQFTQKGSLNVHVKNKHTDDGSTKDYKCLECDYQTNYKCNLQKHLKQHRRD